jgi:hypothetical protein
MFDAVITLSPFSATSRLCAEPVGGTARPWERFSPGTVLPAALYAECCSLVPSTSQTGRGPARLRRIRRSNCGLVNREEAVAPKMRAAAARGCYCPRLAIPDLTPSPILEFEDSGIRTCRAARNSGARKQPEDSQLRFRLRRQDRARPQSRRPGNEFRAEARHAETTFPSSFVSALNRGANPAEPPDNL